jgi:subtilisin-like proprotein convertase family protein
VVVADFDFLGSPTEDLDGDGRLGPHEPEFFPHIAVAGAEGVAIVDGGQTIIPINVANRGEVENVLFTFNAAHSATGQLRVSLRSPAGTTVVLMDGVGGSGDNVNTTVFDDLAATSVNATAAPFGGRLRPSQPLSAFNGESMTGVWQLIVDDLAPGETGVVNRAIVSIKTPPGTIDRVEPFAASYDLFITRAGASDVLLVNAGGGRFVNASDRLPAVESSNLSYASAVGNLFLRSLRQIHGAMTIDRPLVDVVVGKDELITEGNSSASCSTLRRRPAPSATRRAKRRRCAPPSSILAPTRRRTRRPATSGR